MKSALVGHTGFVGGTLLRQRPFDDLYNSRNVEALAGKTYDLVACAAAPGVKWKANQEPEQDLASIRRLTRAFESVKARQVVLISTVDVYPHPIAVDEETPIDRAAGSAYGRHRLLLEDFLSARFETLVVRLPGLFGDGLKKNIVYDLLNGNRVDQIVPNAIYQFFDLATLWDRIAAALGFRLRLVNFATEPTSARDVAREAFGVALSAAERPDAPRYDLRTRHARLFGAANGYLEERASVLAAMRRFVEAQGHVRP